MVINRTKDTIPIEDIIFKNGQFDGVKTKEFKRKPQIEAYIAAILSLCGSKLLPDNVIYYANEETSTDRAWIKKLQPYKYKDIGQHTFYYDIKNHK